MIKKVGNNDLIGLVEKIRENIMIQNYSSPIRARYLLLLAALSAAIKDLMRKKG